MSDRLAAAQAALNAGRKPEAIDHLIAAINEDPARALPVYRVLAGQLYSAGRYAEGEAYAARGLERYPRDYELLNTRGVFLRRLHRYADAVPVLEQALKLNPKNPSAQQNLANVFFDMNDAARAEPLFAKLARSDPRNSDHHRMLGRCLMKLGRVEPALVRLRQAVALKRDNIEGWLDLAGALNDENRPDEAAEVLDKALAQNPGHSRLLEGKVIVMRRSGQAARAETLLRELLPSNENAGWLHFQLGAIVADKDREQANVHFARAVELEPSRLDYAVNWIESLERTRSGDEGANVERAYQLALKVLPRRAEFTDGATKIMSEVFARVCDFDAGDQLGDLRSMGRAWAENGRHTAFLKQLARVRSDADRLEVVEQHRAWGRKVQAAADRRPIQRPPPRPEGGKIRLGLMSSDLRRHPVGYFAMPLFEHIDRERFEVFVYSYFEGREDPVQRGITERISGYRWWPDISVPQAAQRIADDQLDILVELGGSTHMNKPEVMAYRPAPVQASWLGYPHSLGLETIDYLICDPWIAPADPALLIEKPLVLKDAWYPLSALVFSDQSALNPEPPVARNGYVTFGTANQPGKFNRECLRAWAKVMARCPNSRFLFIRPEGSSPSFRNLLGAAFEAQGIDRGRLDFEAVRGAHLPHYNRVDITLDPFPQTGGTTTCESMWMGAPCVSLVGPAPYERLSYSVLNNVGLGDLCASSVDEFIETAVRLAADPARIADLRAGMRERMRASPLGQTEAWARDFYDTMARAVRGEA